jgi:hypothetical protein
MSTCTYWHADTSPGANLPTNPPKNKFTNQQASLPSTADDAAAARTYIAALAAAAKERWLIGCGVVVGRSHARTLEKLFCASTRSSQRPEF